MNEQNPKQVGNSNQDWIPFDLSDLQRETSLTGSCYDAIPVIVEGLLADEQSRLSDFEKAAKDMIRIEQERLVTFEDNIGAKVRDERRRSSIAR